MPKIEIHNLEELIKQNYPTEIVENLIYQVLILSMQVKTEYPEYKNWFLTTQVLGIYDGTRNIIIAHIKDRIVGFVLLKKIVDEKKICTFYVEKYNWKISDIKENLYRLNNPEVIVNGELEDKAKIIIPSKSLKKM